MKRTFLVLWACLGLGGLTGCTPAGTPPTDDSFSLKAPAGEPASPAPAAKEAAPKATLDSKAEPDQTSPALTRTIAVGERLRMTAPERWVPKPPAISMIAYEFAVPAAEGDSQDGRVTVMMAGGSADANVDRWIGQFSQPDGSDTKSRAKVEKKTIAGREVQLVDISGTYKDARGPFAPAVDRPDYRMLAAIIPTAEGNCFVKLYGPKKTVGENGEAFQAMVDGLK